MNSRASVLTKPEIEERLERDLFIRPLLDKDVQINNVGIDLRLGYDFLVSIHSRDAYINATHNEQLEQNRRSVKHLFQETRRQLGGTFILHPNQTILGSTLEYVKLPEDVMMLLTLRSSYNRLGLSMSTIVQPGYCGCLSVELTNPNFTAVNLTVGARVFQAILFRAENPSQYFSRSRKYSCQVRPEPSAVLNDRDLTKLNAIWKSMNSST